MASRTTAFALTFVALFALSYAFLAAVDALPEPVRSEDASNGSGPLISEQLQLEMPVRITASSISLREDVLNPESTDIAVLDDALLRGAVRYPTSALLGQDGTVLIFGHSSGLPIVQNQNFKAFNGIRKLKAGDIVSVFSAEAQYRYAVTGVRLANATEDVIELPTNGKYLTLVTCDSFGKKSSRYVVTATLEGVYAL